MRTLEQIREENKKCHLLFHDTEEKVNELPFAFKEREQKIYQNFIKPISRKTIIKYLNKILTNQ